MESRNRLGLSPFGTGAAVMTGLVIGLGVLLYVRDARTARSTPAMTNAPHLYGIDAGGRAPGARTPVRIVAPAGARIFANGQELPFGITTVPRPEKGFTPILVKADGRQDAALVVDSASPDEIEVKMALSSSPAVTAQPSGPSGPAVTGARTRTPRPPAGDPAVPPNPYQ